MAPRFIRIRELASTPDRIGRLPVAPATIWRWTKSGAFPQPVQLGPQTTAWRVEDVERWEKSHASAEAA
jgi:prophage regulatory protein